MRIGGDYQPQSSLYNRPVAAFPCGRADYYLTISSLGTLVQGQTGTVKATRRKILLTGPGTDGHVVRVSDGTVDIDFELDDDGAIAAGSEVAVQIGASARETAYNLANAIASNAQNPAGGTLRNTIDVQHLNDRVILRNYGVSITQLTTSTADASFALDTYLVYNPEDFAQHYSSVPNYQTPGVSLQGPFAEPDQTLTAARIVMYGLDVFDNPVASEIVAKTNSNYESYFYFPDIFSRVDQIRVYDFEGDVADQLKVGYPLPQNTPYLNPDPAPYAEELAWYSSFQGASYPFIQGFYLMQPKGFADTTAHNANDGCYVEYDTGDTGAINVAEGDELWVADEDGGVLFTITATPTLATDILLGTTAMDQADLTVAAINAYFPDERFLAKRLANYSDTRGMVHVFGSERAIVELTRGDPPALIATTDWGPKRYVDLDATTHHSVFGVTAASMRDGDLLVLSDSTGEDVMEFESGGGVVAGHNSVAIGANGLATVANLVAAINGMGAPNTDFKAINVGGVTFQTLLVRGDAGGRGIWLATPSSNMQVTHHKAPIARRSPLVRMSVCGILPQAVGHYNEATGAPFQDSVFVAFPWDVADVHWDPYGVPYRTREGIASSLAPRVGVMDPSLATSTTLQIYRRVVTGALAGAYYVASPDPYERASRGLYMHPSYRNSRRLDIAPDTGKRYRISATSCPPYQDMPTGKKGGRR